MKALKCLVALVLSCFLLGALLAAANEGVHQAFHPDASSPTHSCLATTLAQSATHLEVTSIFIIEPSQPELISIPPVSLFIYSTRIVSVHPTRGPPAA